MTFRLLLRGVSDDVTHLQIEVWSHQHFFILFCCSHSTCFQGVKFLVQNWHGLPTWLQCSEQDLCGIIKHHLLTQQEHHRYPQHHHRHPCHQQLLLQIQRCQHSQAHSLLSVRAEEPYSAPFKTFRKELWRKHTRVTTVLPGSAEADGYTRIEFPLPLLCCPGTRPFWPATDSPTRTAASHAVAPFTSISALHK